MNLNESIEQIQKAEAKYDGKPISGCTAHGLEKLAERFEKELNIQLDAGYAEFLKISNGIEFNGHIIYACERVNNTSYSYIEDIVEENLRLRMDWGEHMANYIVFGESDLDLYLWNLERKKYQVTNKPDTNCVFEEFSSFEELISYFSNHCTS